MGENNSWFVKPIRHDLSRFSFRRGTVLAGFLAIGWSAHARAQLDTADLASPPAPEVRVRGGLRTQSGFLENRGQWPVDVLFFARAGGIDATLMRDAIVFRPTPPDRESGKRWPAPIVLRLPGVALRVAGESPSPTRFHYFVGSDSTRWAANVRAFDQVIYHDVAPGIDLVLRVDAGNGKQPERFAYDLHLAPGADLESFAIDFDGVSLVSKGGGEMLTLDSDAGRVDQHIGACWQVDPDNGAHEPIAARFDGFDSEFGIVRVQFRAEGRDPTRAFVLDPTLAWATYVGGPNHDQFEEMAVDPSGATYLACRATASLPTTPNSYQTSNVDINDNWVGKLSPDGSTLIWATYLGGDGSDGPNGLELDSDGTVVVFGSSHSTDFPTTPGALQTSPLGDGKAFVSRLSPDGSSLIWSTYFGESGRLDTRCSALFPNGDVLIAVEPETEIPPSTTGAFDTTFVLGKQILARIAADGSHVVFQTYFQTSRILDMVIDEDENIYFGGNIYNVDGPLPATPGAFMPAPSSTKTEAYVVKMRGDGASLAWATYLGGANNSETVWAIDIDAARAVYVCGQTASNDFPTTAGAFSNVMAGPHDGFVTKILPGGSGLVWSTYIGSCCGGGGYEEDLTVDVAGNVVTVGFSNEPNHPTTPDAFQPHYIGPFPDSDSHMTKFDAFGTTLVYSTWLAGTGTDYNSKVELSNLHDPILVLQSYSTNFPVTPGAYDSTANGSNDVVVAKFDLTLLPWRVVAGGKPGAKDWPNLAGAGPLTPGSMNRIKLVGAPSMTPAVLFVGFAELHAPVLGGTFVPTPDLILPISTDGSGGIDLPFQWPNVPTGITLSLQVWVADLAAAGGWTASNALRMIAQ